MHAAAAARKGLPPFPAHTPACPAALPPSAGLLDRPSTQQQQAPPQSSMRAGLVSKEASRSLTLAMLSRLSTVARPVGELGDTDPAAAAAAAAALRQPPPRPVLRYGGRWQALLQRRAAEAGATLARLQQQITLRRGGSVDAQLPKAALRFAKVRPLG